MQNTYSFAHNKFHTKKRPFDHCSITGKKKKIGHFLWLIAHNKMMWLMLCAEAFDFLAQRTRSPVTEWC